MVAFTITEAKTSRRLLSNSSYNYLKIRLVCAISSVEFFSLELSQLILHLPLFDRLAAPVKEQKNDIACKSGTKGKGLIIYLKTIKETTLNWDTSD